MSDRDDLLRVIKEKAVVHGDFVLSSGQRASWYIDLRRVLLAGQSAPLAGRVLLAATADLGYDAVGGLTLGADPVAAAMMHAAAGPGRTLDALWSASREGARATAADRGSRRGRAPGAGGGGHLHHRGVRPDRGGRAAGGGRGSGSAWPCWSTGAPGTALTRRGLPFRAVYDVGDLGLD